MLVVATVAIATWAWFQPVDGSAPTTPPSGSAIAPCPEAGGDPVTEPQLVFPEPRLDAEQSAAIRALAASGDPLPCGAIAGGDHGHGDDGESGSTEPEPGSPEAHLLDRQWQTAQAAATALATPEAAAAAGYVKSSPQAPGVGTHWIDWRLIDAPFDPARPSMLLFDERAGRPPRLVGFSYWTRSAGEPPAGFAGDADVWHRHLGLCFVDGWLYREDVPAADGCSGSWLNGSDLWMLHAWVVEGFENPAGRFAGRHAGLCPGDREQIADALRCDQRGGS